LGLENVKLGLDLECSRMEKFDNLYGGAKEKMFGMTIDTRPHRIAAVRPYPPLFATISGAHLYGLRFPKSATRRTCEGDPFTQLQIRNPKRWRIIVM